MSKLIISGIPRSGTTYLFRSVNNLPQSPWSPHFDKIVDHAHYLNDTIKVHTPYNNFSLNEDIKVIFLHRNLFDWVQQTFPEIGNTARDTPVNLGTNLAEALALSVPGLHQTPC